MSTRMVLGLVCSLVVMLQGLADYPAKPVRIIEHSVLVVDLTS
jgi:hypothetical protein